MTLHERHRDRANRLTTKALWSIGEELREARLQAAMSIRELASITGVSAAQISRIERGTLRHVAYETIASLAAALGLVVPPLPIPPVNRFATPPNLRCWADSALAFRSDCALAMRSLLTFPVIVGRGTWSSSGLGGQSRWRRSRGFAMSRLSSAG